MRLSGLVFFVFWLVGAQAQIVNVRLDDSANDQGKYPVSPGIAISFKDTKQIVAGSSANSVYVSDDGGKNWKSISLVSEHGAWNGARILSDFSGNLYYLHEKGEETTALPDRITVRKSKDGGKSWDAGTTVGYNPPKNQYYPNAVADRKGNIYLTWTEVDKLNSDEEGCASRVMVSKSSGGSKWSKPVTLSLNAGDCKDGNSTVKGAVPAVSHDGKIFVAWAHDDVLFIDRSFDGGNFWLTNDIAVLQQRGGRNFSVPGIQSANGLPVLVCNNTKENFSGALYLVWAEQVEEDDTEIYFTRSLNYGDNWTHPVRINDDEPGSYQFMPAMTVDQVTGHIYILYYDRREHEDNHTDVYLAYSADHGATFRNVKVSETPFLPQGESAGTHISIAAHNGIIMPVWTRIDNGKSSIWTATIKHTDLSGVKTTDVPAKKKKKKSN
ncbi:MAG: exo-alpha-sialidase [Cyclobacteriaceae bacterium]|nr:exo-alpha-sialidase [Cyclobacteriaceae bacterium]